MLTLTCSARFSSNCRSTTFIQLENRKLAIESDTLWLCSVYIHCDFISERDALNQACVARSVRVTHLKGKFIEKV